jgi:hypothetical protein
MKGTKTLLVGIMALAGGAAVPAHATTVIEQSTFSGTQASFFLSTSTSITCSDGVTPGVAELVAFVSGAQQVSTSRGTPQSLGNGTLVEVEFFFDSCTGAFFFGGDAGIANSFTPPDTKLTSASMVGSGTAEDFNSPPDFLDVAVNVSMVGTGSTSSEKASSHSKLTGTLHGNLNISHSQSANSNREATVSGTITAGGVTFDASQAFVGELISNSSSSISVSKQ